MVDDDNNDMFCKTCGKKLYAWEIAQYEKLDYDCTGCYLELRRIEAFRRKYVN